jgi:hypothetical protein
LIRSFARARRRAREKSPEAAQNNDIGIIVIPIGNLGKSQANENQAWREATPLFAIFGKFCRKATF